MSSPVFTIKIAGPAGAGIKSTGLLLSKLLVAHGLNIRDYSEYPSLIRGGHNTYQVSFSQGEVFASHYQVDLFFSLTPTSWQAHTQEFTDNSLICVDDETHLKLPIKDMCQQLGGNIYANTICLGVSAFIFNLNLDLCRQIISTNFGADSPNNKAFDMGYDYAQKNYSDKCLIHKSYIINLPDRQAGPKSNSNIYDGNEAYGWGFIKGGGNFYAAYPMTPATGALHFLAAKQDDFKITVVHPEDEIAAASMVCGATFAGSRSATGTSGGGFALMVESVSFAGAANLGVVFYLVSRPGPATGLPTWTGQGDLLFAVHAGHGEFNKIVLAAGDQQEAFDLSVTALNLAAKFNIPVILLSDKFISESSASLPDLSVQQPKIIKSELPIPGTPDKEFMANSYEHGDDGYSTEDSAVINKSVEKRLNQLKEILPVLPPPKFYFGSKDSSTIMVSFGSVKSTIWEALRIMNNPDITHLHFTSLWPLDPQIKNLFNNFKNIIVVENNATSQLVTLLKSQFDFNPTKIILKYDGRPFFPEELIKMINEK